jgi:GGDEF domain-containing protein
MRNEVDAPGRRSGLQAPFLPPYSRSSVGIMKPRAAFSVLRALALLRASGCALTTWFLGDQPPDSPETARVKTRSYVFAMLAAAPGLLLILVLLLRQGVYLYAALHSTVIVGVAVMFPLVLLRRMPMLLAERYLAGLLVMNGGGFLLICAQYPGQIISFVLLGNILLFIVAGLLLVLPPRLSIALSLCLLAVYQLGAARLGAEPGASAILAQWVNIGMFALLIVGVMMRQTLAEQAGRVHLMHETLALRDALTGLFNRRGFETAVAPLRRGGGSGSLIVLDIDDFKPINDTYGHIEGDRILEQLAGILQRLSAESGNGQANGGQVSGGQTSGGQSSTPQSGVCARWGGEEFLLYLPEPDLKFALHFAERLRAEIGVQTASHRAVTVSAGVGAWPAGEPLHQAFLRADTALYAAKRAGKNCVRVAPLPTLPDAARTFATSGS